MVKNIFSKVLAVINVVSQVVLAIVAVISLITAYVVFAPDDLPKPFRLVYDTTNGSPIASLPPVTIVITATPEPVEPEYKPGEGIMLNMSTKIINLVDPGGRKYIRVTIVVEFAPENPDYPNLTGEAKTEYLTEFEGELNTRLPTLDDTVIMLLSTKTYEDLYTAEGKEELRAELLELMREKLEDQHILNIYFTEFVVQ